ANSVVNHNHAAAALEESLEILALLALDRAGLGGVHHEHIAVLQLCFRGEIHRTIDLRAALGEQLGPVLEEARVIMLPRTMGFRACPEEDAQLSLVLSGRSENKG